jgi:hypothetical protein
MFLEPSCITVCSTIARSCMEMPWSVCKPLAWVWLLMGVRCVCAAVLVAPLLMRRSHAAKR